MLRLESEPLLIITMQHIIIFNPSSFHSLYFCIYIDFGILQMALAGDINPCQRSVKWVWSSPVDQIDWKSILIGNCYGLKHKGEFIYVW